jgi:hypothetical protein
MADTFNQERAAVNGNAPSEGLFPFLCIDRLATSPTNRFCVGKNRK